MEETKSSKSPIGI